MSSVKDALTKTRETPEPCNECGTPVYQAFAFLCQPCDKRLYLEFAKVMGYDDEFVSYISKLRGWG